eukprot:TRINITY_DN33295_c0_g2_i2.p1 TRINITY_DN33295_c0_g2~~TRINITY_DN33295_c0_g2_i2.p1  ORF type:complete len:349 (-),score=74.62 TRINITY_DN33295_c0_g2_i2:280-1326(-)
MDEILEEKSNKGEAEDFDDLFNDPQDDQPGENVQEERDLEEPGNEFDAFMSESFSQAAGSRPKKKRKTTDEPPQPLAVRFDKVLLDIRPKKGLSIREEECHPFCESFVKEMIEVARLDLEDHENGIPMLHKMKMLPKAVEVMDNFTLAPVFVTYGGAHALGYWMKPLPNGELPNVHLRTRLLLCMERLPITKDALKGCTDAKLGQIVAALQQHPKETVANRKVARQLVQKWLKQVLTPEKNEDSLDALMGDEDTKAGMIPRPPELTEESLREIEETSASRLHPTIPIIESKAFVVHPQITAQPVRRQKVATETYRGKLGEVLKVISRPNKKAWKPYSVSIAGRHINAT